MAASGIRVNEKCELRIKELKAEKKLSFVIFKISDDNKEIEVDTEGEAGKTFDDFKAEMMKNGNTPRYALHDFNEKNDSRGGEIVFVSWVPDDCPIKQRMLYASSKDALKKKITGLKGEWQINDAGEFTVEELKDKLKKK